MLARARSAGLQSEQVSTTAVRTAYDTYLVPPFVSDEHYERPMILLDIIVNEDGDARIELLAHEYLWWFKSTAAPEVFQ